MGFLGGSENAAQLEQKRKWFPGVGPQILHDAWEKGAAQTGFALSHGIDQKALGFGCPVTSEDFGIDPGIVDDFLEAQSAQKPA